MPKPKPSHLLPLPKKCKICGCGEASIHDKGKIVSNNVRACGESPSAAYWACTRCVPPPHNPKEKNENNPLPF